MDQGKKLTVGFKLFQPWATKVVNGKLAFLIRSTPTKKRGRVAVIATRGIDDIWMQKATEKEMKEVSSKGVIGSVKIKNCITVEIGEVKNNLIRFGGKNYWEYYPKHLIPKKTYSGKLYIWALSEPKKWDKPVNIKGGGILWAKMDLSDQ